MDRRARAAGKVILLGEHAVVYGAPALAAALDRGATARAFPAERDRLALGTRSGSEGDGSDPMRALGALRASLGVAPHAVEAELEMPAGSGLGASAALGVAIARALVLATEPDAVLGSAAVGARVLAAAAAWEGVFHGNASGVDAAAAASSGCIHFSRAAGSEPVRLERPLPLAVAVAGPPASTREMVASVARLRARRPEIVDKAVSGVTALVNNARLCLEAGDLTGLGKLMDLNQMLLSGLMVSTESIERACDAARRAGALGAKLTGAGGGGCVVALADGDPEPILATWRADGLACFAATVGGAEPA
ncbi:MAG TPA: mevalonate kinase [Polyangiaceae bacterium]|nr:mevalonate kinase [Polyangiaceae bacterium]